MSTDSLIEAFAEETERYEDCMFGLMLYQETAPQPIRLVQSISYKNMRRRGDRALEEARKILADGKAGKDVSSRIQSFEWPVLLEDMRYRIEILLACYADLFPDRPREKRLSRDEVIALRNAAVRRA